MNLALCLLAAWVAIPLAAFSQSWNPPPLADPNQVKLGGAWGDAYARGMARLDAAPFTTPFVLADLDFNTNRWFTNFSGDISGRFLEVTALASTRENPQPPVLREILRQVARLQKADGHFGADVRWDDPIDFNTGTDQTKVMPILWGNGRLLLGLVSAYERFGQPDLLASARKLADFYVNIAVNRFCDPTRTNEYWKPSTYAGNYVTCVYEGMEGLVQIYRVTRDERYLQTARRMADFHEQFDTLPVDHSHGSLSQHGALLMLYETTGEAKYLQRVVKRWERAVNEGFINPSGGVLEKFWITGFDRDEGCAEADWLRLNLMLWRLTGQNRYLDMAERLLWNEYLANQWPTGGYGHRFIGCDDTGPFAYLKYSQESLWCCSFHAPLALYHLKNYLAMAAPDNGIYYNFPVDFTAPVNLGGQKWTLASRTYSAISNEPVMCEISLAGPTNTEVTLWLRIPDWAERLVISTGGTLLHPEKVGDYLQVNPVKSGARIFVEYEGRPYLENRRLQRLPAAPQLPANFDKVAIRFGPHALVNAKSGEVQPITLYQNEAGILQLPGIESETIVSPYFQVANPSSPHAFLFNVQVERMPTRARSR